MKIGSANCIYFYSQISFLGINNKKLQARTDKKAENPKPCQSHYPVEDVVVIEDVIDVI